jgi:hypothetical protein|tara:strand:+ start:631 stop:1050 length:420 start_codon:yes stop_codon:yes gene_type:complete
MAEEVKLKAVAQEDSMTAKTRIQTLEADVKIEARYKDEPEFTVISDTAMAKGEVKSEEGAWEKVPAGKEMVERKVTITPKNIAWYKSRTAVTSVKLGPGDYIGSPGESFKLVGEKPRTKKLRKTYASDAKTTKLAKLKV